MPLPSSRIVAALWLCVACSACSFAQGPAPALAGAGEGPLIALRGTLHPLARPENDRGAVADSFPASRMLVLLNPPADRQKALQFFLRDAHNPASLSYHRWLTPEQFGAQFGARDEDVQQVETWLQSHGFAVNRVTRSRRALEFSGTAAQVRKALHAPIHQYQLAGKPYYSVASEVSVPQSIAPLLKGFAPLNNFPLRGLLHTAGKATYAPARGRGKPEFTTRTPNGGAFYAIAPEDLATQYDITPLYQAGTNGAGQTIGVIGEYNLDLTITAAYRALFGLPSDNTQVVIDGTDPGSSPIPATTAGVGFAFLSTIDGSFVSVESGLADNYLSVEISGAVAPMATVNYYLAGGSDFQSLVALAAMRAVEDNQASVLSVAYHQCEQILGPSGNAFWSALWEQAAAQGQTVLVSSGDEGPAACGVEISSAGQITYPGPSVSGLASTPWNVAVGASDFYYSDYATGAASAAGDWNASNDANFGSLKAPRPEQPWDDELGLDVPELLGIGIAIINPLAFGDSTGGGASNCSQLAPSSEPAGLLYACVSGYAKPAWQNAPGVPADGARDIPDVALLAAEGANLSAYAVCIEVDDCAPVSSGEPQVTLAGGPAASTAAMAGIMAMIDQKYGRQGQANFVLYALAQQQPGIFHDITVGTNDVVCVVSAPNCTTQVPNVMGEYSFGVYNAGPGYDLASGLGSVDVNELVTDWSKITFSPTSTTLQLSPASIEHGAAVSVTATVKAASGTLMPTGDVSIETTSATPVLKSPVLTLASGAVTANLNFLPGGTYPVTAQYAGDGTFAPSTSPASTLTVTPEPSTTLLLLECNCLGGTIANGGSVPLSSHWTFAAQPTGQSSLSTGEATGTATFTDSATSVTVPLTAEGIAYWSPQSLAVGAHSVTVSYSGDASYNASNAGPLNFTVSKGSVVLSSVLEAATASVSQGPPVVITYQAGSTALVRVSLGALNSFVQPTGNVTISLGSLSQTVGVTSAVLSNESVASANAFFPNVAAGTYALSASYTGDSNWSAGSTTVTRTYTFTSTTLIPTTTVISLTPASADSSGVVTFAATVTPSQGQNGAPYGSVSLFANGYSFGIIEVQPPAPGSSTAAGSLRVPATAIPSGNLEVTGIYQGSGTAFMSSTSAAVALTVTLSDFTLSAGAPNVTVTSGETASIPLLLGGPNGGSATVSLNCLPSGNFYCSVTPSSATVKGATTASLTINAYSNAIVAVASAKGGRFAGGRARLALLASPAVCVFAFALLLALPHRRTRPGLLCCAVLCGGTLIAGCGGGSSGISPPPPPLKVNTPPGTYTVVVTATSGTITHNVKFKVLVQ